MLENYQNLSSLNPKIKIAPVLKSNAYGHGIEIVGKILDQAAPPFICVDSLFEALQLKKAKVKTRVLIMGYIDPRSLETKKYPFSYAVYDLDFARALNTFQKGAQIHVFVGTGMSREGVPLSKLENFLKHLKKLENLKVNGIMSHLASSDNPESDLTKKQVKNFNIAKSIILKYFPDIEWFHLGGSLALLKGLTDGCNLIRCGKALYGLVDGAGRWDLKPVLSLKSKIVQIKKINKGARVGYSETFTAKKEMVIGILPIGYNDGVDRRLSNKGVVIVSGIKCPIIGLISMNITTIDLSAVPSPFLGQEAVVFSDFAEDANSVSKDAVLIDTIPHEILVHLNPTTRREVF